MSHYMALVVIPQRGDAREHVTQLMEPYRGKTWDWWVIGGRFTGRLSGYQPTEDPQNWETCELCGGTGERPDGLIEFGVEWYERMQGCNGCHGKGWRVRWPTEYVEHEGDVQRLGDVLPLPEERRPWALLFADGTWISRDGGTLDFDALSALDPDLRVVVVDYHC